MSSIVYLDIETAAADPATWSPKEPITAPATYKDPDKIAAYIEDKRTEQHGRTSFDVHAGRLLCVGIAVNDGPVSVVYDKALDNPVPLLSAVADALAEAKEQARGGKVLVCGHNVAAFDAPWLWRLAVRHRHRLALMLPYRKWGDGLADTMQMWSATNPREMVGLSTIARFLDLGSKADGMSGAEVWPAYLRGEHARISAYCAQDVELLRSVYLRMVDPLDPGF